jgi:hypothetical protein
MLSPPFPVLRWIRATCTTLLILSEIGCASAASSTLSPFTAPAQLAGFNIEHDFDRISDDVRVRIEQHLGGSVAQRVDATYADAAGHHLFMYVAKVTDLTDAGIHAAIDDTVPANGRDALTSQNGTQFVCRADTVPDGLTVCTWRDANVFGLVADGRSPTDSQRAAMFAAAVRSVVVTH